jgi:hypothetical protein
MNDNEWSVDLPNWHGQPDPEIAGSTVWVLTDYDGKPILAIAAVIGDPTQVSVVENPMILPGEIDGCELGTFPDWDTALDFALAHEEGTE